MQNLTFQSLAAVALVFTASGAWAMTNPCDRAAERAARAENVPLNVLRAISRVETGRTQGGQFEPWPWTVNLEGKGFWFKTEAEAKTYLFDVFRTGARSFDVGCFQINYRWHGQAFRSIDAMFDPDENATYAARFLRQLYVELGSWPAAAGAYHSRTQSLAQRYTERFRNVLAGLDSPGANPLENTEIILARPNPLIPLQADARPTALGSLVPDNKRTVPFIPIN